MPQCHPSSNQVSPLHTAAPSAQVPWVAPNTVAEKAFGCITLLGGAIFFAFLLGSVVAAVQAYDRSNALRRDKMGQMLAFSSSRRLPSRLTVQLMRHVDASLTFSADFEGTERLRELCAAAYLLPPTAPRCRSCPIFAFPTIRRSRRRRPPPAPRFPTSPAATVTLISPAPSIAVSSHAPPTAVGSPGPLRGAMLETIYAKLLRDSRLLSKVISRPMATLIMHRLQPRVRRADRV